MNREEEGSSEERVPEIGDTMTKDVSRARSQRELLLGGECLLGRMQPVTMRRTDGQGIGAGTVVCTTSELLPRECDHMRQKRQCHNLGRGVHLEQPSSITTTVELFLTCAHNLAFVGVR